MERGENSSGLSMSLYFNRVSNDNAVQEACLGSISLSRSVDGLDSGISLTFLGKNDENVDVNYRDLVRYAAECMVDIEDSLSERPEHEMSDDHDVLKIVYRFKETDARDIMKGLENHLTDEQYQEGMAFVEAFEAQCSSMQVRDSVSVYDMATHRRGYRVA